MIADIPYSEPFLVPDIVISGLAHAEQIAPHLFRLSFYVRQKNLDGTVERVIVLKCVMEEGDMRTTAGNVVLTSNAPMEMYANELH